MIPSKSSCPISVSCLECLEDPFIYSKFYEYKKEITPKVIRTSPNFGPSKGGNEVSFELDEITDFDFTIENLNCTLIKVSEKLISCLTGEHKFFPPAPPRVRFAKFGFAHHVTDYELIDVWSDETTWGCNSG